MRLASSVVCFEYARLSSLHSGETLRDMRVEHAARWMGRWDLGRNETREARRACATDSARLYM